MHRPEFAKFLVRVPLELKEWLRTEAVRNASSQVSEVVRSIRFRMEAEQAKAVR